eukprot:31122-Pelagococcus_subviridis.AAC.10
MHPAHHHRVHHRVHHHRMHHRIHPSVHPSGPGIHPGIHPRVLLRLLSPSPALLLRRVRVELRVLVRLLRLPLLRIRRRIRIRILRLALALHPPERLLVPSLPLRELLARGVVRDPLRFRHLPLVLRLRVVQPFPPLERRQSRDVGAFLLLQTLHHRDALTLLHLPRRAAVAVLVRGAVRGGDARELLADAELPLKQLASTLLQLLHALFVRPRLLRRELPLRHRVLLLRASTQIADVLVQALHPLLRGFHLRLERVVVERRYRLAVTVVHGPESNRGGERGLAAPSAGLCRARRRHRGLAVAVRLRREVGRVRLRVR